MSFWAHPSAVIDPGADIGEGTKVWHFSHVMEGARVGAGCVLGQNVFVARGAAVGDGCRIQNDVSIYDGVVLEREVFVGPSAVFTNVRVPRAFVDRKQELVATIVGRGASIGANATLVCGVQIGAYALVAAGAVVTRDVAPHALVAGVPARRIGWVCACGEPLRGGGRAPRACARCGAAYLIRRDGPRAVPPPAPRRPRSGRSGRGRPARAGRPSGRRREPGSRRRGSRPPSGDRP